MTFGPVSPGAVAIYLGRKERVLQTVERAGLPALRRLGAQIRYGLAIGLSLVLIYVVQKLEEWEILGFLTTEFGEVVPWITFSLIVGVVAYLAYIVDDSQALRLGGEVVTNLITIVVTWRVFAVFPFDFSAYEFPWEVATRIVLLLALVGASIGVVANVVKLVESDGSN